MTKQDAINLLTQKDQLQLLSFYDTLTPEQQESKGHNRPKNVRNLKFEKL